MTTRGKGFYRRYHGTAPDGSELTKKSHMATGEHGIMPIFMHAGRWRPAAVYNTTDDAVADGKGDYRFITATLDPAWGNVDSVKITKDVQPTRR